MENTQYERMLKFINNAKTELSRYSWFINYDKAYNSYYEGIEEYYKYIVNHKDDLNIKKEFINICIEAFELFMEKYTKIYSHNNIHYIIQKYLNICNDLEILCVDKIENYINTEKDVYGETNFHLKQLYKTLAENYKINKNYNKAIQYYEKVILNDKIQGLSTNPQILKEIIKINILNNDYITASFNYQEIVKLCMKSELLKLTIEIYLVCSIILIMDLVNEEQIQKMINEYKTTYPKFEHTSSYIYMLQILDAYKKRDTEKLREMMIYFSNDELLNKINYIIEQINRYK
jgi:hypothetical protein